MNDRALTPRRRSVPLVAIVTFAAALVPATVGRTTAPPPPVDCVVAAEPNDEAPDAQDLPATEACVTAEDHDASQDVFNWTVGEAEAGQRWTIAVTGIPAQAVTLQVYRVALDDAGTVLSAEKLAGADGGAGQGASLADLLWPAGEYLVGVGTSGPGPYELTIFPGAQAPATNDSEPNDAAEQATAVAGEFAVTGDRAGTADWFAWDIDDAAAAQQWELRLQLPVLMSATLHLSRQDGTEIFSGPVNALGSLRLPDLGLDAGRYLLYVDGGSEPPPAPYILEAVPGGPRVDDGEAEPNDMFASATTVTAVVGSTTVNGRLAAVGPDTDRDVYRLVVDAESAGRQIDVKVFWRGGSTRRLCMTDASGNSLQCGDDSRAVAFNDVVLQAGEYGIEVSGQPVADEPYLLRIDVTDEATSGFEAEPNDTPALATPLDVSGEHPVGSGRLAGHGGAPDTDVFRFTVTDEPQLWHVTASGPGVTTLRSLDAVGTTSGSADAQDGTATLYDVFLLPGDRSFSVTGASGDYTIEAVPLGPPDPQAEHEPNDSLERSQPFRLSEVRLGRLVQTNDADVYRFSLQNDGRVVVNVDAPADAQIQMALDWGGTSVVNVSAPAPGDDISFEGLLEAGDYAIWLTPITPSAERYELTVEALDPYVTAVDAEPNNDVDHARPIPDSLEISGTLDPRYRYGDADWYVIPAQATAGPVTFDVADDSVSIELWTPDAPDAPETTIPLVAGAVAGGYSADLPADTPVLLGVTGLGDYNIVISDIVITPDGGAPAAPTGELPIELELDGCDVPVAAYWPDRQRVECELAVTNIGDAPIDLTLDAITGNVAWTVDFGEPAVTAEDGATITVPVAIHVGADAWSDQPILVSVRASGADGFVTASTTVVPSRDEVPHNPEPNAALPPALLGGLDVAWSGLGAAPVAADEAALTEEALLHDQQTPVGSGWYGDASTLPVELTVDLAGDDLVPVAGITLNPQAGTIVGEQLRGFDLELSLDGTTFTPALSGELSALPVEQAFALAEPVDARFARLRVRSTQNPAAGYVVIGEWAVIAEPGWSLASETDGGGLELAALGRGGHVVGMTPPLPTYAEWNSLLVSDDLRQTLTVPAGEAVSWVIGFHQDRAARLTSLTWTDSVDSDPTQRFGAVGVAVSVESSSGPWEPVGTWTLDHNGSNPATFQFAEPTWARFVRVTGVAPPAATADVETVSVELPNALHVYEQAADDTYRSAIGQWGQYQRAGIYERLVLAPSIELDSDAGNDAASATMLPLGDEATDSAWVGRDEDWYRIAVPDGESALAFTLTGTPTVDVDVALFAEDGGDVELEGDSSASREITFTAVVERGGTYLLRVTEPPSSVVFAFDTSLSMGPYSSAVLQGVTRYVGDVRPGEETVNILPFGADLLLDSWTDEPYLLQAAVTNYPQTATSSDAEGALLTSMDALSTQHGARAVVLVTDAQTGPSLDQLTSLATSFDGVRPRVYAVHVAGGTPTDQDLMQDWASVNNGLYTYVVSQGAMDVAFDRAATVLRRPSVYSVSVEATEPPAPPATTATSTSSTSTSTSSTSTSTTSTTSTSTGTTVAPIAVDGFVRVLPAPVQPGQPVAIGGDASVAIILDTSGSMLQDLEGGERIDAARSALTQLVTQTIPAGTNVSLRVFGDTPDSCDSRLLVPQSPLDQAAMASVIQNVPVVDGVKTPIGASLQQVAGDLGTAPGPKIVVLVTDGEETCDGNPAAAIQALIDSGIDVRVNIVGFALDDEALKAQFQEWARLGNGQYIDAGNQAELTAAVAAAVQPTFDVLHANGTVIASGQVGGDPVALPAGTYALEVRSNPPQRFDITIVGGQTLDLPLP